MKRATSAAAVGALLLGLLTSWGPAGAQDPGAGFRPISIYSLDDASTDDTVPEAEDATPAGTAYGDPVPTEDRFGDPTGATSCDGVDDYIQTEEPSNVNPLTFSAWFRADDVSGEHSVVDSDGGGLYGHSLIIGYDDPNDPNDIPNDASLDIQYHDGFWDTGVTITQGEWTQVFVTYSNDTMKVYVGTENRPVELVAEQPYDTTDLELDGSNFRFCRHNEGDPQFFEGAIDDIRFYDTALDPTDPDFPQDEAPEDGVPEDTEPEGPTTTEPAAPACPPTTEIPPVLWGDVHVRTLDALTYDFQFTGDFVAAQTVAGEPVLQARMKEWENPRKTGLFSVNAEVAMDVAGDEVVVVADPEPALLVNGAPTAIPTEALTLPAGGSITPSDPHTGFSHDLAVEWPDGETGARLQVSERPFIDVGICSEAPLEGLVGNPDGDPGNDMQPREGDPVEQPASLEDLQEFGDSWRAGPDESLFPEPLTEEEAQTPDELITIDDLPEEARAEAEQACADQGITDPLAIHSCTYDVAATGDEGFVDSADAQEAAVEALPESTPEPVAAIEATAPEGIAVAGTDITATSDPDDGGSNTALLVGLGALVVALLGGAAALLLKRGGPGSGADPTQGAGPPAGSPPSA